MTHPAGEDAAIDHNLTDAAESMLALADALRVAQDRNAELTAENERMKRAAKSDSAGLDRWCNYQDRLFAVMSSDEIRAFEARLSEGGWTNEPLCRHAAASDEQARLLEQARNWATTLEGELAAVSAAAAGMFVEVDGRGVPTLWKRNERRPIPLFSSDDAAPDVWALIVAALTGGEQA